MMLIEIIGKKRFILLAGILLASLVMLLPASARQSQPRQNTTPIDFNANSMQFDRRMGEDVRRLLGDVVFIHEDTRMTCDSAYLFTATNSFRAFSNIFIQVSDTVSIYGDRLDYDGNTRVAVLSGKVRMVDPQMTLTTSQLIYDLNSNTANYSTGGRIVDADNVLTSRWGFYYADEKRFFFRDDVVLTNPEYVMNSDTLKYNTLTEVAYFFGPTSIVSEENIILCQNGWYDTRNDIARFSREAYLSSNEHSITGDSLFYDRTRGYGRADRNILIRDSIQNTLITGHFAEHFEKEGLSIVTDQAVLTVVAENDSLFLHADTLKSVYYEETEERWLFAYHKAKFFRTDLQGKSDSIVYSFADSTIFLYHDPVLWTDVHQLTAKHIQVITSEEEIKTVHLYEAAFVVSQEDTLGFNQVKGRNLTGHFRHNELWRIDVFGNGETIYYVREEDGTLVGINKALSSDIVIFVEDRQVVGIRFLQQPDANLFPPEQISGEDRLLRHFQWLDHRRPKSKQDIFSW
jgi:lipopolysaccharide export system protein LptA